MERFNSAARWKENSTLQCGLSGYKYVELLTMISISDHHTLHLFLSQKSQGTLSSSLPSHPTTIMFLTAATLLLIGHVLCRSRSTRLTANSCPNIHVLTGDPRHTPGESYIVSTSNAPE